MKTGAFVAPWLARCASYPVKAAAMGSTPDQDWVKDRSSVLPSQHLSSWDSPVFFRLRVDTACTEIVAHVKDLMSTFR